MSAKTIGITTLAAIAIGAGIYAYTQYFSPLAKAKHNIRLQMLDGESAIFEKTTYNPKTNATCGYINSKNRFGGYTGFQNFIMTKDLNMSFEPAPRDENADLDEQLAVENARLAFLQRMAIYCLEPK